MKKALLSILIFVGVSVFLLSITVREEPEAKPLFVFVSGSDRSTIVTDHETFVFRSRNGSGWHDVLAGASSAGELGKGAMIFTKPSEHLFMTTL